MRLYMKKLKASSCRSLLQILSGVIVVLFLANGVMGASSGVETNRLLSVSPLKADGSFSLQIIAEHEIGTQYSVYESIAPQRVVVELHRMDVQDIPAVTKIAGAPVTEVRVAAYDRADGKLGRIDMLQSEPATPYTVQVNGAIMVIDFSGKAMASAVQPTGDAAEGASGNVPATPPAASPVEPPAKEVSASATVDTKPVSDAAMPLPAVESETKLAPAAKKIIAIEKIPGGLLLKADGQLANCKTFTLRKPDRFVADCFAVKNGLKQKSMKLSGDIRLVRVGDYTDKIRFVFEGNAKAINKIKVYPVSDGIQVKWDGVSPEKVVAAVEPQAKKREFVKMGGKAVEAVDFKVENGKSLVIVTLSSPGEVMQPIKDKSLIRFGIKDATIAAALRRTIDASAFPSVIRQVTPYIVSSRGRNDVRFAVELKQDSPYELKADGNTVTLVVENGELAAANTSVDKIELQTPRGGDAISEASGIAAESVHTAQQSEAKSTTDVISNATLTSAPGKKYSGQLVSLNFDNIEIRNVLLLIAEVSNRNIIASEDVKGTITLRLNNVPWDQALDVILQIKGLGMKEDGNIVRIMPLEKLRAMQLDELKAANEGEKLEALLNESFVINYTALDNIVNPVKDVLSPRGKVYKDDRSKKVFVTDVSSVFARVRKLIAELDTPEKQVMIEARIVEANSNFTRDLGVSWGVSHFGTAKGPWDLSNATGGGGGGFLISPVTQTVEDGKLTEVTHNIVSGFGSGFTFGRVGIDSTVLDLRLSALETSGYGKIVSTPRIATVNGKEAEISQGTQIPYQTTDEDGKSTTELVDAALSLKVTPVLNPDDSMILSIEAANDSIGSTVATGTGNAPTINKKKAKTQVIVKNGETTVIGGIFIETEIESEAGIPLLRSIPILGNLFKSTRKRKDKSELLIFITPRIVE